MIISVNYHSKYRKMAQEVRCPYNQLRTIFNFIKENPNKRYVVVFPKDGDYNKLIEQVEFVKAVANDYTIQCSDIKSCLALISQKYNAYLKYPVTDWETFENLRKAQVTDIYIDGPLGFQCKQLAIAKKGVKIRISPTVSPNSAISAYRLPNSFFVRPEDLQLQEYQEAIDVIDFNVDDTELEDTLYGIYSRGNFNFAVNSLFKGLPYSFYNVLFDDEFGATRATCGQRCKVPGHFCHYCDNYMKMMAQSQSLLSPKKP